MSSTPTTIDGVVHAPGRSQARGHSMGDLNRIIAWTGMACGAALGLIMGLWSFDGPVAPPNFIGDYTDTARRLLRLGHIACFGIGILNLLLVRELFNSGDSPPGRAPCRASHEFRQYLPAPRARDRRRLRAGQIPAAFPGS